MKRYVQVFEQLDPEVMDRVASRRDVVRGGGKLGAALALASVPVAFAAAAREAFAQALPQEVVDVLNFALTLEHLENSFYMEGLGASGLIPGDVRTVFQVIQQHEQEHVSFLQEQLGGQAGQAPQFDFTAGGMFDPFESYETFLLLSQAFEDTGVRAYKGAAPALLGTAALTPALTIHSVEARHAARVRGLRGLQGWIPLSQPDTPEPVAPVYQGMGETVKYEVNVVDVSPVDEEQVTESFDEALEMQAVLAIVQPFLKG